jgi:hypothetical protein
LEKKFIVIYVDFLPQSKSNPDPQNGEKTEDETLDLNSSKELPSHEEIINLDINTILRMMQNRFLDENDEEFK